MIELINLEKWKKQQQIIDEFYYKYGIIINSRKWRKEVEVWNKKFLDGEVEFYITHSNKRGYKATKSYQEAKEARNDYLKRAFNMMKKARECDKAFQQRCNYQIDFENGVIK